MGDETADESVLLSLLRAGLLEALGDDEQRRSRAATAAAEVCEWLVNAGRPHFVEALVVATTENQHAQAESMQRAEQAVLHDWPSFRNAFPDRPDELLRAILLQAAVSAAGRSSELAAATWYAMRSVRELGMPVGERSLQVDDIIAELESSVRERLRGIWSPDNPELRLTMPKVSATQVQLPAEASTESLRAALDAVQPAQSTPALAEHVPPILDAILAGLGPLVAEGGPTATLKTFAGTLGRDLRDLIDQQRRVLEMIQLRESLLWWRLSGWSESLEMRYADIGDPARCAAAAALDLHRLCPPETPEAVEHLLADVVAAATSGEDTLHADLATVLSAVRGLAGESEAPSLLVGSSPLAAPSGPLAAAQWAVLGFRELQLARLMVAPPESQDAAEQES